MNNNPATEIPEDRGEPITGFICHITDRTKARKTITKLTENIELDEESRDAIRALPLRTQAGVKKNALLAMSRDTPVLAVNMKTGEVVHF